MQKVIKSNRVRTLYDMVAVLIGNNGASRELTEGKWLPTDGNTAQDYDVARKRQLNFLLDKARVKSSSSLLEIGCGNGSLLLEAQNRNAKAFGITLSPEQVKRCLERGADAKVLNYRNIPRNWSFDAVIANGSIEHFVQPEDFLSGGTERADEIYTELFDIVCSLLPSYGCFATTTIHMDRDPSFVREAFSHSPLYHFMRGDREKGHISVLAHGLGGFYPALGQLERCAKGKFKLVFEEKANDDYAISSDYWIRQIDKAVFNPVNWVKIAPFAISHPYQTALVIASLTSLVDSWREQFVQRNNPKGPFGILYRHVWQKI